MKAKQKNARQKNEDRAKSAGQKNEGRINLLLIFLSYIFLSGFVPSIMLSTFGQEAGDAQDLFASHSADRAKGRPGARVRIELLRDGVRRFARRDEEFRSGDKVKLHFEVNFPAYVEIYNEGSSGDFQCLFPFSGAAQRVNPTSDYVVPGKATQWFEFDETPGVEKLIFIFSAAPMKRPTKPAPRKPPPAAVKPTGAPKPASNDIAHNRPDKPAPTNDIEQALHEINARGAGDDEDSKDFRRVETNEESYIFSSERRLRHIVREVIYLRHR